MELKSENCEKQLLSANNIENVYNDKSYIFNKEIGNLKQNISDKIIDNEDYNINNNNLKLIKMTEEIEKLKDENNNLNLNFINICNENKI